MLLAPAPPISVRPPHISAPLSDSAERKPSGILSARNSIAPYRPQRRWQTDKRRSSISASCAAGLKPAILAPPLPADARTNRCELAFGCRARFIRTPTLFFLARPSAPRPFLNSRTQDRFSSQSPFHRHHKNLHLLIENTTRTEHRHREIKVNASANKTGLFPVSVPGLGRVHDHREISIEDFWLGIM
jgi:hypothetical protein